MTKFRNIVFNGLMAIFGLACIPAHAQMFTLSSTTFSAAVAKTDKQVCVASATGISVPTVSAPGTLLFADSEPMPVLAAGTSSTCFVVDRRAIPEGHISGATVYLGPPNQFFATDKPVGSSCTASQEYVLPYINTQNGKIFNCLSGGQWILTGFGTMAGAETEAVRAFCTGTVGSAETEFLVGAACSGATTSTATYVISSAGTLANLRVVSSAAVVGGTNKDVLTVDKNGSDTAITCTLAASGTTCSDTTHSVAVAAGDVLTFKFVTATSDTAANMSVALEKYTVHQ